MGFLDSMKNMLGDFFLEVACAFFNMVLMFMSMVNVPEFSLPVQSEIWQLMQYMFYLSNLSYGFTLLVSTYVARFALRRLPFVG